MERSNVIFIHDLHLEMNIGIFEQEKRGPQAVLINAEIALDPALVWRNDDIAETVAYDELVALIEKISAKKHYELIETFLEATAEEILKIGKVRAVKLSVQKPGILKNTGAVGVEITRTK